MGVNEQKLETWYRNISKHEEFSLSKTKKMLKIMNEEPNELVRQMIREQIIIGTLHVVYKFIKSNEIFLVENNCYDMDDIINSCIEIWINVIDSNILLNARTYSISFITFYNQLAVLLFGVKDSFKQRLGITYDVYEKILIIFLKKFKDKSYDQFYRYVKAHYDLNDYLISRLYILFTRMYEIMGENYNYELLVGHHNNGAKVMLFNAVNDSIQSNEQLDYSLESKENEIYLYQLLESSLKMYPKMMECLKMRMLEQMTLEEIKSELGISATRIHQLCKTSINKIRKANNQK